MEVRFLGGPERDPWVGVDWDTNPNWELRTAADLLSLPPEYLPPGALEPKWHQGVNFQDPKFHPALTPSAGGVAAALPGTL
jgi:hypothetical protein